MLLTAAAVVAPPVEAQDSRQPPTATPVSRVEPAAEPAPPPHPGPRATAISTLEPDDLTTPKLDAEIDALISDLRRRGESTAPGSQAADRLESEISDAILLVQRSTREALRSWSDAASKERAAEAWDRVTSLEHALGRLVAIAQSSRDLLSANGAPEIGFDVETWRRLSGELDHLALRARLYRAHRLHDVEHLPTRFRSLGTLGELASHALLAILVIAVASWFKRRGPDGLERIRQAAFRSFRRIASKRRIHRITSAVEVLLPWGSFVLGIVGLRWALGPLAREVELDIVLGLALVYGVYRMAVDGATGLLMSIAQHYRMRVRDEQRLRLERSVRAVLRITALLLVIGLVSSRWLGRGVLAVMVDRFAWLFVLLAVIVELFRWRTTMVDTFLELSPDSPLATAVRQSRDHWYGTLIAPAAFVWLSFHGLTTVMRDFALRFDETQKALAFLFRRRVERQAEREGYADEVYDDVPPAVIETFSESAIDRGPLVVAHFPGLEELQAQISEWRKSGAGGSTLVRGERGIGKTTWLNQLRREDVDILRIELGRRVTDPEALIAALADRLGVSGTPGTVAELSDRLESGPQRIVILDLAQHLFLARIGGYRAFSAFAELVNRTRHQVFWIAAMAEYACRHLRAVHPDWAVFRREIALGGWPEERIRELIRQRCEVSGITFNYADVAVDRIEGVTSRARLVESADGYLRLLWDYSNGNPRVALHFFVRSLDPDHGDRLRVRLFRAPDQSRLEAGGEAGLFVVAAIVTHESASVEDLATVTRSTVSQCHIHVDRLVDLGAARFENGLVRITTAWQRAAVRLLRRRNLLPG